MTTEDNIRGKDTSRILSEIIKLSNEVQTLKEKLSGYPTIPQKVTTSNLPSLEITSIIDLVKDQIEEANKVLISEIKSEFYKLITLFYSSLDIDEKEKILSELNLDVKNYTNDTKSEIREEEQSSEGHKEYISRLVSMIEEREQLIYELSDQVVVLSVEKSEMEKRLKDLEKEKEEWSKVRETTLKLVSTDPRYRIVRMLKQLNSISQMQLSFVLGISLSQTKQYLKELEEMNIVQINEDNSVQLHPEFDETTL